MSIGIYVLIVIVVLALIIVKKTIVIIPQVRNRRLLSVSVAIMRL